MSSSIRNGEGRGPSCATFCLSSSSLPLLRTQDNYMMAAAHELISSFRTYPYKETLRWSDYRIATVYEADRLLEAIREHCGSGSDEATLSNAVRHELVPASEEEAFRLKDGYLLDFGTLRTFYRDSDTKFSITHKLCVSNTFSVFNDTRRTRLLLPLALLHACAEEDVDEIDELVNKSVHIKGNVINMDLVSTPRIDDVLLHGQADIENDHVCTEGGECTQGPRIYDDDGGKSEEAKPGLALLYCGTPWLNGGTALHFCVWAGKINAAIRLFQLEMHLLPASRSMILGSGNWRMASNSKMPSCQDHEGNPVLSWAAFSNIVDTECINFSAGRYSDNYAQVLHHVNLFGSSSILFTAKQGNLEAFFQLLHAEGLQELPLDSALLRQTYPHLFDQLEGNNFMHYLVLRPNIMQLIRLRDTHIMRVLLYFMVSFRNHIGLTAFQVALCRGVSEICEWVLRSSSELESTAEFAYRGLAITDGEGRNILHQYAEGGASKEVGRLIIERLNKGEAEPEDQSVPMFQRRAKEVGRIREMIREVNLQGETPCIVALRRGNSDAFEMLMRLWGPEELAMHYLNPRNRDNILHCYAKSMKPGVSTSSWSSFCNSFSRQKLLNAKNMQGLTPLMCALYHGQADAFTWLLQQEEADISALITLNEGGCLNALHLYAYHFDNEVVATDLLRRLARDGKTEIINWSISGARRVDDPAYESSSYWISGTPLEVAVERGNARTCDALLGVPGILINTYQLLYALCRGKIEDPQSMWHKLTGGNTIDPDLYRGHINTPLVTALEAGNIRACEWLLAAKNAGRAHFETRDDDAYDVFSSDDESGSDQKPVNALECRRVFESFAKGDFKDKGLWDKLKTVFDLTPKSRYYTGIPQKDISAYNSSKSSEDCALMFLKEPGLWAEICHSINDWMSPISMKSFKVLAQIRRHKYYCHILRHKNILNVAAKFECFELFDMALQAQSHQEIQEQYANNHYKDLLRDIISTNPLNSSSCFLQLLAMRITEEKCSPLIISWTSFMELSKYEREAARALLWASVNLAARIGSPPSQESGGNSRKQVLIKEQLGSGKTAFLQEEESGGNSSKQVVIKEQSSSGNTAFQQEEERSSITQQDFMKKQAQEFEEMYLYCSNHEPYSIDLIAMGRILVSEGLANPIRLLLAMERGAPKWVALMLQLLKCDDVSFIVELLQHYCKQGSINVAGNIHAALNHLLHHMSIYFSNFRRILASPWTAHSQTSSDYVKRNLLHQVLVSSKERHWDPVQHTILLLHYFRFFELEDSIDHTGATALHLACMNLEHPNVALTLLTMCPHLATLGRRSGRTPLHDSAFNGFSQIVDDLLSVKGENALLNERDADGRTALHFAAASYSNNAIEIVRSILAHAREKGDYAALLLCASAGHAIGTADKVAKDPSVALLLREEMAREIHKFPDLLQLAIVKRSDIMIRELINRGAEITKPELLEGIELDGAKESDQPSIRDSLGRGALAKGIAALLLNPYMAVPITIGVFGPWGMGKSSVMIQTEIALMMTIIERNLLPTPQSREDFLVHFKKKEVITRKGKELHRNITRALQSSSLGQQQNSSAALKFFTRMKLFLLRGLSQAAGQLTAAQVQNTHHNIDSTSSQSVTQQNPRTTTRIKRLYERLEKGFWNCWTRRNGKKIDENIEKSIQDFVGNYTPALRPLYKGLALMDRKDLFQCQNTFEQKHVGNIPSCITVNYNAWLYHGEKEASSGLAFTILKEIEECLNTAQWLRLCWRYAYKSDPIFIFSNITLPFIVCVLMGGWVLWLMWKLLSLPSIANNETVKDFRYGSLPLAVFISTWIILRNVLNVIKPVSEQVVKALNKKISYEEKLGYSQQIIDDIEFFKEQLGEEPGFGWRLLSQMWNLTVENKDVIPLTNIRKSPVQKQNLRIIVFVDDLDRCTESAYVLQLLAAINLILSVCSINVVIGIDKEMMEKILESHLCQGITATRNFLEKIIQLPIDLTDANEQEMSSFLQYQLSGKSKRMADKRNAISTHEILRPNPTVHRGQSTEGEITILTAADHHHHHHHHHINQDIQGECNDNILNSLNMREEASEPGPSSYENSRLLGSDEESMHLMQALDELEGHDKLAIHFPLLVSNYTEREVATFRYLQSRAKSENRTPRAWKRLLNYHRLAWYVIIQTKSKTLRHFNGWQEQFIVWVFICYNWKNQMDEIFKNWQELLKKIIPNSGNEPITLHQLIDLHMMRGDIITSIKDWKQLANTLFGTYDIDIRLGIHFQNYRFHCGTTRLELEDNVIESDEK